MKSLVHLQRFDLCSDPRLDHMEPQHVFAEKVWTRVHNECRSLVRISHQRAMCYLAHETQYYGGLNHEDNYLPIPC